MQSALESRKRQAPLELDFQVVELPGVALGTKLGSAARTASQSF